MRIGYDFRVLRAVKNCLVGDRDLSNDPTNFKAVLHDMVRHRQKMKKDPKLSKDDL